MFQKITKNFYFHELRPKGQPKTWLPSNTYQSSLIFNLTKNLQVVRSAMPKNSYIQITSGMRSPADYERLVKLGYNPSKTSDHNYGNAIKLSPNTKKFKKYGPTYNFSVGAADCFSHRFSVKDLFLLAKELTQAGKCKFGQIIYEYNPKTKAEWVHFGGDPGYVFSDIIVAFIERIPFMESLDGGKSYQIA